MNLNAKARLRRIARECKNTSRCKQRETFTEFLLEMVKYCSVAVCTKGTHNRPDFVIFWVSKQRQSTKKMGNVLQKS